MDIDGVKLTTFNRYCTDAVRRTEAQFPYLGTVGVQYLQYSTVRSTASKVLILRLPRGGSVLVVLVLIRQSAYHKKIKLP
jgi:hypothetical protein